MAQYLECRIEYLRGIQLNRTGRISIGKIAPNARSNYDNSALIHSVSSAAAAGSQAAASISAAPMRRPFALACKSGQSKAGCGCVYSGDPSQFNGGSANASGSLQVTEMIGWGFFPWSGLHHDDMPRFLSSNEAAPLTAQYESLEPSGMLETRQLLCKAAPSAQASVVLEMLEIAWFFRN